MKKAILLFLSAIALFGVYQLITNTMRECDHKEEDTFFEWNVSAADITEVSIQHPGDNGEKLIFNNIDGTWALTLPEGLEYNQSFADGLPLSLEYINSDKKVAEGKTDLSQYGLDSPVVITVNTKEGTSKELHIGDKTPTQQDYYMRMAGNDDIYTLSIEKAESIQLTAADIRNKNILELDKTQRLSNLVLEINKIKYKKNEETVISVSRNDASQWEPRDESSFADEIADAISKLLVQDFIEAKDKNLQHYSLDPARYSIEFEYHGITQKLLIGSDNSNSEELYARLEDSTEVFTISKKGFDFLTE